MNGQKILSEIIEYCKIRYELKELNLDLIGNVPKQPETIGDIKRQDAFPEYITYNIIRTFSGYIGGFTAVNYFAHYGFFKHFEDLNEMGFPEYPLNDFLSDRDYMEKRKQYIIIPGFEEIIDNSLISLSKKYNSSIEDLRNRYNLEKIV